MVRLDAANKRMWTTMAETSYESVGKYLETLCDNTLQCPICQEFVQQPVTTSCGHTICSPCLCKGMKQYGVICPICRSDIADIGSIEVVRSTVNQDLVTILKALIPSYGNDWLTKPTIIGIQRALRTGKVVED
ncbi:E3 ubiquitin-protein ligase uhrf1 [Coemansia sp. S610]|nr:E3 ubiquitin-protein ligase uhrf1 [Coemansia sp. S610]KAJ2365757.1 E3 ubiquitin-protein ligase uhrf1 [Coemansia sp. RSA 2611]